MTAIIGKGVGDVIRLGFTGAGLGGVSEMGYNPFA